LMHCSVGAQAAMAGSAQILADMAKLSDRPDLEKWFRHEAKDVNKALNGNFWDKKHSIYNDLNARNEPITDTPEGGVCKHGFVFWPLVFKGATAERAAIMADHATDPRTFFMPTGIASLTADSKYFNPETGGYWRGSSWPPNNWIVIKGLEEYGMDDKAQAVAVRYYDAFLKAWKDDGDIREFLWPNQPKMHGCETFVGWGGIAPIAILIENLLGIQVDAPRGEIEWHVRQLQKHGVEDLWFGGKTVSLICEARKSASDPCRIHVTSDGDFVLKVKTNSGKETALKVTKGENEFQVK
jgi:glycogen debranching enzyme